MEIKKEKFGTKMAKQLKLSTFRVGKKQKMKFFVLIGLNNNKE